MDGATVWFNPSCSKCRTTQGILAERGISTDLVEYLENTPDRDEIERVMRLLGVDHARLRAPRSSMRCSSIQF